MATLAIPPSPVFYDGASVPIARERRVSFTRQRSDAMSFLERGLYIGSKASIWEIFEGSHDWNRWYIGIACYFVSLPLRAPGADDVEEGVVAVAVAAVVVADHRRRLEEDVDNVQNKATAENPARRPGSRVTRSSVRFLRTYAKQKPSTKRLVSVWFAAVLFSLHPQ